MATGDWLGANPQEAAERISEVQDSYNKVIEELNELQSSYIAKIAENWGSPNAKSYMDKFIKSITGLASNIEATYKDIINHMNAGAREILSSQGYNGWSDIALAAQSITLTNSVPENIDGKVAVRVDSVTTQTGMLHDSLPTKIGTKFALAKKGLNGNAYLGGAMESTLSSSIDEIREHTKKVIESLADSAREYVEQDVQTVKAATENVETSFGVQS